MITFNYLMTQALIILNAKLKKENTAKRVGGLFRDLLLFLQNLVLGIILKGEKEDEAAIKAISNPTKGDTYKAIDTGHYWCYDGAKWNDIGELIPSNIATKEELNSITGGSTKTIQQLDYNPEKLLISDDISRTGLNILSPNNFKLGYYWHWTSYYYAVNPTYGASQYYPTTEGEILYLVNIHSIIYFDADFKQVEFILNPALGSPIATPPDATFFLVNVVVGYINAGSAGVFREEYPTNSFRRFFRVLKESSRLSKYPYDDDYPVKQSLVDKNVHKWLKDAYIDFEYEEGLKYSFSVISKTNKQATLYKHIEGTEAGGNITNIGAFSFTKIEGSRYYLGKSTSKPLSWVIADFDILTEDVNNIYYYDGIGLSPRIFSNGGNNVNTSIAKLQEAMTAVTPRMELIDSLSEISVIGNSLASKAESVYDYDTSSFSGWASYIGVVNDINGVLLNIKNRDKSTLTKVRLRIKSGGYTGTILADITKDISIAAGENKDLAFNFKLIENAENEPLWVEYATDKLSTILRIPEMKYPYTPDAGYGKVMYTTNTGLNMSFTEVADSALRVAAWMVWGEYMVQLNDEQLDNIESRLPVLTEIKQDTSLMKNELEQLAEATSKLSDEQKWESDSFNNQNNASSFSGWGCHIGVRKNFNAAEVCIINRDADPITKLRVAIFVKDYSGSKLADKTIDVNIPAGTTQYVIVPFYTLVANSDSEVLFLQYWCDKFITRRGYTGSYIYTQANGYLADVYSTNGSMTAQQPASGSAGYPFYFRVGMYEDLYQLTDKQVQNIGERLSIDIQKDTIDVELPGHFTAVVRKPFKAFYRGLIKAVNPYIYDILITCSKGNSFNRYFSFTPGAGDVGELSLKLQVKDNNGNILGEDSCKLITVAPREASRVINELVVGDSLTSSPNKWIVYADAMLKEMGITTAKFVGRVKVGDIACEGSGGWQWPDYTTEGRPAFRFFVSGVSVPPAIGSVYTNNGFSYTIQEINITGGTGYVRGVTYPASNVPQASGILTRSSGGGDTTLNYSSYSKDVGNPFWNSNTQEIDIKQYVDKYCDGKLDIFTTLLSWNGQSAGKENFTNVITDAKKLFDKVHEQYPNCRILIMGIPLPCIIGGMTRNYGATGAGYADAYGMYRTVINQNKAYKEFANSLGYKDFVEFVNLSAISDVEYDTVYQNVAVNDSNPTNIMDAVVDMLDNEGKPIKQTVKITFPITERQGLNGVHPDTPGNQKIGWGLARETVRLINKYF